MQDNRKLLIITGTWPEMHCGVGDYTRALSQALIGLDWEVHVLTSRPATGRLAGATVYPRVAAWDRFMFSQVEQCVREVQPDVINLQWPTAAYGRSLAVNFLPARLRKLFPRIPVVLTLHEVRYFKWWTRLRLLPGLNAAQSVILVDPQDAAAVQALAPRVAARCSVIPIGSNLPAAEPGFDRAGLRRQWGFQPGDFVVTFFGFANPPKGLDDLLQALGRLRPAHPRLRFLLLSQLEGKHGRRLEVALRKLGLAGITANPDYAGPAETAARLATADAAVLPFKDGLSLKRGSVMACLLQGLPLVSTLPAGAPFADGANALLVPASRPEALARAVERLMREPGLAERLSRASRELAQTFGWEAIARRQHDVFRKARKDLLDVHRP